jgi:hypothetical protein
MRAIWGWLRGLPLPAPIRVVVMLVVAAIVVAGLFVLFEWAGDLLDSGGTVGL